MARYISISGPSVTGKTTLVNHLKTRPEMKNCIFSHDIHDLIWQDLVEQGYFTEYDEIVTDQDFLCTFIMRVVDSYNAYINAFSNQDTLIILDRCWIDYTVYANLNMWYTRVIKSVQEEIFQKILHYNKDISRIYITKVDDINYPVGYDRMRGKMSTFRMNRPLEIQYYEIFKNLKNAVALDSSDVQKSADLIIDDLKNLGYLQ